MDNEALLKLHRILDQQRSTDRFDLPMIVKSARESGIHVGVSELRFLASKLPPHGTPLIYPEWLSEFIIEYRKQDKPISVFDPWAGSLLLVPLTEALNPELALGIIRQPGGLEIAAAVGAHTHIQWIEGDSVHEPNLVDDLAGYAGEGFDLIVSCPPFGLPSTEVSLETDAGPITVRDSQEAILILRSSLHLAPNGVGLFVVTNRFFQPDNPRSVYASLPKYGLAIDAVLALPEGTFLPQTSIATTLISIRGCQSKRLFVGELSAEPQRNLDLLRNLNERKPGPNLSLGALVDRASFRSYGALAAQEKARDLARTLGLKPAALSSIALEINFTQATEYPGFPERPNAIYLPLVGQGDVISSLAQASLKQPSRYAQIVLDPEQATDVYVARFLNTTLGRTLREAVLSGSYVPRTSRTDLRDIQVYLPEPEVQLAIIDAETQIANLQSELATLRDRLWAQPRRHKEIVRDIHAVNREQNLSDWLDTLPFPLASILWAYSSAAGDDHKQRYEHLLHFFEALAEFSAAVLLSGFRTDPEVFAQKRRDLRSALSQSELSKGTFGTWVRIAESLAKDGRTLHNGKPEDQARCRAMFRTSDRDVLAMLFNSDIITVLQQTNELRNQWAGHGGVVSPREAQRRLTLLESHLSTARATFSEHWTSYQLIKPGTSRFVGGVHQYQVERIMGTRTPFQHSEIATDVPMDYQELYLLGTAERYPLKLFPLIKVMPSPKTAANACYFYNRTERDTLRFVSYHFEEDADIYDSFPDTAEAITMLMRAAGEE